MVGELMVDSGTVVRPGKKIVLSIYTRSCWRKSGWRKAVELEALTIFVNDNAGEEAVESGQKIFG
jgi:hypothetical protein